MRYLDFWSVLDATRVDGGAHIHGSIHESRLQKIFKSLQEFYFNPFQ